jgi:hypothetical protein
MVEFKLKLCRSRDFWNVTSAKARKRLILTRPRIIIFGPVFHWCSVARSKISSRITPHNFDLIIAKVAIKIKNVV